MNNTIHIPGFGYASVAEELPSGYVRLTALFANPMTLYRKRDSIPALAALPVPVPDQAESIDPMPDVSPVIDLPKPAPAETEQIVPPAQDVPEIEVPAEQVVVLDPPVIILGLDEPPVPDDATEPLPVSIVEVEPVALTLTDVLTENARLKARVAELEAVIAQHETRLAHAPQFVRGAAAVGDNPHAAMLKREGVSADEMSRAGDLQVQAVVLNALRKRGLVI